SSRRAYSGDATRSRSPGRVLDLEPEGLDHGRGVAVRLSGRGEIAVDEDGVRRQQRQPLRAPQAALAPAGSTNLGARVGEPEQRQRAQATPGVRRLPLAEGRPVDGMEKVDRQ